MPIKQLPAGEFLGPALWQRRLGGLTLTLSRYRAGGEHSWHTHACNTFFLLIAGQHRDETRRLEYEQRPFVPLFHPTTEPHVAHVGPTGMTGLNVEYGERWLTENGLAAKDFQNYRILGRPQYRLLGLRLLAACGQTGPTAEVDLSNAALEILEPVARESEITDKTPPRWLARAEDFLHAKFPEPISLRDVAREAGVHPVYCARVFRRCRGLTVSAYLRALRLAEAARLVLEEGWPMAEAAYGAGFADQAHFCRCCSQLLGRSPKALRAVAHLMSLNSRLNSHEFGYV
ncbi:MAG: helix-turn-helix transcriptional regulator [Planctomycetes bacterium]|nr:helix-turn-helix transcriptional regulator [Planctomycetota bacterium]